MGKGQKRMHGTIDPTFLWRCLGVSFFGLPCKLLLSSLVICCLLVLELMYFCLEFALKPNYIVANVNGKYKHAVSTESAGKKHTLCVVNNFLTGSLLQLYENSCPPKTFENILLALSKPTILLRHCFK